MKRYIKNTVKLLSDLDDEVVDVAYYTDDINTIAELANAPDDSTKWALLLNKNTPSDILEKICYRLPEVYATALASNPNTSSNLLSAFLNVYGRYSDVGNAVINNPNYIGE